MTFLGRYVPFVKSRQIELIALVESESIARAKVFRGSLGSLPTRPEGKDHQDMELPCSPNHGAAMLANNQL